jgi:Uma2 family endonuclease
MGMPSLAERWTAERIKALPDDGNRYEVISGELFVTPAPRAVHQRVLLYFALELVPYVDAHRLGAVFPAPADIEFADDTLVQPDISVAPLVSGRAPASWDEVKSLLLVVEILSPRTADYDRGVKRRLYQQHGVGEYWIVDTDRRLVERWTAGASESTPHTRILEWQPKPEHAPLVIDVEALFTRIFGE